MTDSGGSNVNIPLQSLSAPGATSQQQQQQQQQQSQSSDHQTITQNQPIPLTNQQQSTPTATSPNEPVAWLWTKGCSAWNWVLSIIMLGLTVAGFVVAKLQAAVSPAERYVVASNEWNNNVKFIEYCDAQQAAGKPLSSDCLSALENGVSRPPEAPQNIRRGLGDDASGSSSSSSSSQQSLLRTKYEQTKQFVNHLGAKFERATHVKDRFTKVAPLLRSVQRRMIRLFHGGRQLGSGRYSLGLPTISSGVAAISIT